MKAPGKTTILLIVAFVITAALGGAYAFLFVATKDKTQATADVTARHAELSGTESRVSAALAALKTERDNIDKIASYFIKESDIVSFTKEVELLGPQSGTTLSIEALEPMVGSDGAPILNVSVKATGSFQNVMRLMKLLENFPGKLDWRTVNLARGEVPTETASKVKTSKEAPTWNVDIALTAHNFVRE